MTRESLRTSAAPYLGDVPMEWADTRLKFVLRAPITDGPHETPDFVSDGLPFLSVDAIQDGELSLNGCRYISQEAFEEYRRKAAPEVDDILMGKAASTGKIARVKTDVPFAIWSPLALLKLERQKVDPRYVEYALKTPSLQQQIDDFCNANTQKNIGMSDIPRLAFALPPLSEQASIANFLDEQTARIDALIAEKERLLETLDEHRYAHLSRVMTIGLDASAALIQTSFPELRSIPRHWTVKRLKFLGEVRSGIAKGKDHGERDTVMLPYLRVANVQDGYVDLTDVQEIEVGSREVDRYLLRAGDVLMNEGGDNDKLGRGTVWEGQIAPCVHQNHVFAVRLRNAELGEWVARFTSTDAARTYFFLRSKQSTNLASINQSNVRELPIPMPPEEERRDILTEVRRSEEATASLLAHTREHIDRLREYRSSLISAAINGQLNIDAFEARPLEAA